MRGDSCEREVRASGPSGLLAIHARTGSMHNMTNPETCSGELTLEYADRSAGGKLSKKIIKIVEDDPEGRSAVMLTMLFFEMFQTHVELIPHVVRALGGLEGWQVQNDPDIERIIQLAHEYDRKRRDA